jgi:hypothetical protein
VRGIGLIVILVPALFGSLPAWPYSNNWGFIPSVLLGAVLIGSIAVALVSHKERR